MKEASKAMCRRYVEDLTGVFPWMQFFKGNGLDVGCGSDRINNFKGFDVEDGDAQFLSRYFPPESFDTIAASQLVEHLVDPVAALKDWRTLLKPDGVQILSFPCFDLYEKRQPVSKFNSDHKSFFSMWRKGYPGAKLRFIHVPTMLKELEAHGLKTLRAELVTRNYDWTASDELDQTYDVYKMAECFVEVVLQKISVDKNDSGE